MRSVRWIRSQRAWVVLGLTALGLLALAAQSYATVWGGGVSPDSAYYVGGARGLLEGQGVSIPSGDGLPVPITRWPPLLPLLLAAPGVIGVDPAQAGRWVNGLLFGVNVVLVGLVLWKASRGSAPVALTGAVVVLFSPDMLEIHSWIWSEPIFIALVIGGTYWMADYVSRPSPTRFWLAASAAGLACLARYIGVALVLVGGVAILGSPQVGDLSRRVRSALSFGFISILPVAGWLARNRLAAGTTSSVIADPGLQLPRPEQFLRGLETVSNWLIPGVEFRFLAAAVSAVLLLLLAWSAMRYIFATRAGQDLNSDVPYLPQVLLLFLAVYVAGILASKAFVAPTIPLDDRILSPAYVASVILTLRLVHFEATRPRSGWLREFAGRVQWLGLLSVLGVAALHLALAGRESIAWAQRGHEKGLGYNSRSWQQSALVSFVGSLPENATVFSNADDGLLFSTGHPVWRLPAAEETLTAAGAGQPAWVEDLDQKVAGREAYIAYFDAISWRDLVTVEDLRAYFDLRTVLQTSEGQVVKLASGS